MNSLHIPLESLNSPISRICNRDSWHCVPLKTALTQSKPTSILHSGFEPATNEQICKSCKTVIDRCPASARSMNINSKPEVDLEKCIYFFLIIGF